MKISAMVLVGKNEPYLKYCIESLKSCVDEIVFVATEKVAKELFKGEHKEKIDYIIITEEGENDYARWRNQAVEASTGDWILWLDADEVLAYSDGSPVKKEDLVKFIKSRSNRNKTISYDLFTLHFMYDYRTIDGRLGGDHWSQDRLFKASEFWKTKNIDGKDYKVQFVLPMHERINWMPEQMDHVHVKVPLKENPPIIFHYGHCKGMEDLRRKYAQCMEIYPDSFKKAGIENVNQYCASHEVFRKTRPLIVYDGPHPKVMMLW